MRRRITQLKRGLEDSPRKTGRYTSGRSRSIVERISIIVLLLKLVCTVFASLGYDYAQILDKELNNVLAILANTNINH